MKFSVNVKNFRYFFRVFRKSYKIFELKKKQIKN